MTHLVITVCGKKNAAITGTSFGIMFSLPFASIFVLHYFSRNRFTKSSAHAFPRVVKYTLSSNYRQEIMKYKFSEVERTATHLWPGGRKGKPLTGRTVTSVVKDGTDHGVVQITFICSLERRKQVRWVRRSHESSRNSSTRDQLGNSIGSSPSVDKLLELTETLRLVQ